MLLEYFEIGPLMAQGQRISTEVTNIVGRSSNLDRALAERIRTFLLDASNVGSDRDRFPKEGSYSLLRYNDYYLLVTTQIGEQFDIIGRGYPLVRRCVLISKEQLITLDGWVGPVIDVLITRYPRIPIRVQNKFDLEPILIEEHVSDPVEKINALANYIEDNGTRFIGMFAKLLETGYVHIVNAGKIPLAERIDTIQHLLYALPLKYRCLVTFSTSTTNPQKYENANIVFVDSGAAVDSYRFDYSGEVRLSRQTPGVQYTIHLDEIVQREHADGLNKYYSRLRLLDSSVNELNVSVSKDLDEGSKFLRWLPLAQEMLSQCEIDLPHMSSFIQDLNNFCSLLTVQERIDLIQQLFICFINNKQQSLPEVALNLIFTNADILQTDSREEFSQGIINFLVSVVLIYGNIELIIKTLLHIYTVAELEKVYWRKLSNQILETVFNNLANRGEHSHSVALWADLHRKPFVAGGDSIGYGSIGLPFLLVSTDSIRLWLNLISKNELPIFVYMDILHKNALFRTQFNATSEIIYAISEPNRVVKSAIDDLLFASYLEVNSESWFLWLAGKLTQPNHIGFIGTQSMWRLIILLEINSKSREVLMIWRRLILDDPHLLHDLDEQTLNVWMMWASREKDEKLALLVLWEAYNKVVLHISDYSVPREPLKQFVTSFAESFNGNTVMLTTYLQSLPNGHPRNILICHLLDVSVSSRFNQLTPLLYHELGEIANMEIALNLVTRIIGFAAENWLKSYADRLIFDYLPLYLPFRIRLVLRSEYIDFHIAIKKRPIWLRRIYFKYFMDYIKKFLDESPDKIRSELLLVFLETQKTLTQTSLVEEIDFISNIVNHYKMPSRPFGNLRNIND